METWGSRDLQQLDQAKQHRPFDGGLPIDLRHTCAALSIAAGAHPKLIAARLGHSTITLTLDPYGHLFPSVEEALAEKLDAAFAAGNDATTKSSRYARRQRRHERTSTR